MFRRIRNILNDNIELLSGKRDAMTPPKRLIFVGEGDYKKTGEEFLNFFLELCALKPNEAVLDVGCGIGRMAAPLTKYLNREGRYEGFDIVKKGIDWCKRNITPRYHNFNFRLADVYNKNYNPKGIIKSSEHLFPYPDESFDFAFASSVFTHMLPQDMENYLSEMSRTLKKGGRCLTTFFLLNSESSNLIKEGRSNLDFKYDFHTYRTIDMNKPEAAISYDEKFVLDLFERFGLKVKTPISYGSWCGRADFLSLQDIAIAVKVN